MLLKSVGISATFGSETITTHQNNGKFLLQLGGVRHGNLQRHDVMLHVRLAVHTFYITHFHPPPPRCAVSLNVVQW